VDFLEQASRQPSLAGRHKKKITWAVGLFFFLLIGLGVYGVEERIWFSYGIPEDPRVLESLLTHELRSRPEDTKIMMALAMVYHEQKHYNRAKEMYEKILRADPQNPWALNNLAWMLATSRGPDLFQPQKALLLAEKAAALNPNPMILDTLAEAHLANGRPDRAIEVIREVLAKNPPNRSYYLAQEKRFQQALEKEKK
jgi:tetratricopeptide (TPR) repeat protein